jgi:hypothetical protein
MQEPAQSCYGREGGVPALLQGVQRYLSRKVTFLVNTSVYLFNLNLSFKVLAKKVFVTFVMESGRLNCYFAGDHTVC